ncbi:MAG: hypothetical protein GY849_04565 [Deltaproteobacteria bacterium]|nr:hypothetical protein [Deltaproteobacteria bacterium]
MTKVVLCPMLFFFLLFSHFPPVHAGFSLGISPVRWEAEGKPGKTLRMVVELRGGAGTIQKVDVSAGDWTLRDNGAPVFGKPGSMPQSAASWVRFHPDALSLYPRQKKSVRVSIRIPEGTPSGSYRTALLFQPPDMDLKGKAGAASVFIRGRLALPIYVTVGDVQPDGQILETAWRGTRKGKGSAPALKIHNRGKAHLRLHGIFEARSRSGKRFEGIIPSLPLLPDQTRWIPLEFQGGSPAPNAYLDLTLYVDLGKGERKVKVIVPAKNDER